ncbi:MAG: hypothetical protein MZW92_34215 [Comamonadaceae bacterium]|nr:hypothetical protein [Comamonadaceae bacterium]
MPRLRLESAARCDDAHERRATTETLGRKRSRPRATPRRRSARWRACRRLLEQAAAGRVARASRAGRARERAPDEKKPLVEQLVHRQHLTELKSIVDGLHPADIAYILEALPPRRPAGGVGLASRPRPTARCCWKSAKAVRETLIAAMDRAGAGVAAISTLEADEIAPTSPTACPRTWSSGSRAT